MSRPARLKAGLLATATQMASVRGLNGLSIGALATTAGMSKGGVAAHHKSKQDLQLAVIEEAARLFQIHVITPSLKKSPGLPRLRALMQAWEKYLNGAVFEGGCFFTNAILELDDLEDETVASAVRAWYGRFMDVVESNAKSAKTQQTFAKHVDAKQFAFEWISALSGALVLRGLGNTEDSLRRSRKALEGLLKRSLA